VRISTEICIEHGSVSAFCNYSLLWVNEVLVHKINAVAVSFAVEFLIKLSELIDFLLLVKASDMELLRKNFNEAFILS